MPLSGAQHTLRIRENENGDIELPVVADAEGNGNGSCGCSSGEDSQDEIREILAASVEETVA